MEDTVDYIVRLCLKNETNHPFISWCGDQAADILGEPPSRSVLGIIVK